MAVDHTSFKVRVNAQGQPDFEHTSPTFRSDHWFLDESGKLAVTREVTSPRVCERERSVASAPALPFRFRRQSSAHQTNWFGCRPCVLTIICD